MKAKWTHGGRDASALDLAGALALGRAHRKKQATVERESQERDAHARAVARSIQKSLRDQSRRRCSIGCRPPSISGSRQGGVRLRRFELMAGLVHPAGFTGRANRDSSFHCKFTGRGTGGHRRAKDRRYKVGEAVRTIRYILREAAREIEQGGVVGNISVDADIVAGLFAAVEELELTAGRGNANVYMSLVVSLPHELTPDERKALLAHICAPLAEHDLPHVGVLHNPDPNGDPRNFHGHVVFSWRPFQSYGDGSYGFSEQTWGELNNTAFITAFRARAAEAMNEAMAAAGHPRRFTPLSRAALGEAPTGKADGKLTPSEKHASRRREDIAFGAVEQDMLAERRAALAQIEEVARTIVVRAPLDPAGRLAALEAAEANITQRQRGQSAQLPRAGAPGASEAPTVSAGIVAPARPQGPGPDSMPDVLAVTGVPSATAKGNEADPATDTPEMDYQSPSHQNSGAARAAATPVSHEKPDRLAPPESSAAAKAPISAAETDKPRSGVSNVDVARTAARNRAQKRMERPEGDSSAQAAAPSAKSIPKDGARHAPVGKPAGQPEAWERLRSPDDVPDTTSPEDLHGAPAVDEGTKAPMPLPASLAELGRLELEERKKKKKAVYLAELTDSQAARNVGKSGDAALRGLHGARDDRDEGVPDHRDPRGRGGR